MKKIKNAFLVSALSLGLIASAAGIAGAATSTNYQEKFAEWFDHNQTAIDTNSAPEPQAASIAAPAAAPVPTPANIPAAVPAKDVTPAPQPTQPSQYYYSDGHSNMNPQQHQQVHYNMNGNNHDNNMNHNASGNHSSGNHMSGGHTGGHE